MVLSNSLWEVNIRVSLDWSKRIGLENPALVKDCAEQYGFLCRMRVIFVTLELVELDNAI